jgi:hypothetical protein
MRRLTILVLALVAAAAVAAPAFANGTRINVKEKFAQLLPKVKQKSGIAVRFPSYLDARIKPSRVYGKSSARKNKYRLDLGVGKSCSGGNACFVASFIGQKGGRPDGTTPVKLTHGISGLWMQGGCGASCAPDSLEWKQGGVVYTVQFKGSQSKLIRLANSAIKAGRR